MDKKQIIEVIKASRAGRLFTNCYSVDVVEACKQVWTNNDDLAFAYKDHGVDRLIFFAKNTNGVDDLLKRIDGGKYFLEFLTRSPYEYQPYGTQKIAALQRFSNPDCSYVLMPDSEVSKYKDVVKVETAIESESKEINHILWTTFRTEISHLLSDEEIMEVIKRGEISVHKSSEGQIDALLQSVMKPKNLYINQVVNRGEKKAIHAIMLERIEQYVNQGGRYLYAWVEDSNIASVKFHQKYGMKHDGMWNMVYCLEK